MRERDMENSIALWHHSQFVTFPFYIPKQLRIGVIFLPVWLEMCHSGQNTQEKQQMGLSSCRTFQNPGPQLCVHTDWGVWLKLLGHWIRTSLMKKPWSCGLLKTNSPTLSINKFCLLYEINFCISYVSIIFFFSSKLISSPAAFITLIFLKNGCSWRETKLDMSGLYRLLIEL